MFKSQKQKVRHHTMVTKKQVFTSTPSMTSAFSLLPMMTGAATAKSTKATSAGGASAGARNEDPCAGFSPLCLPVSDKDSKVVNELLDKSLTYQYEYEIFENASFVVQVLHMCLKALKIPSTVCYGYRLLDGDLHPHVWLKVKDFVIDNCYDSEEEVYKELRDNYKTCYREEPFKYDKDRVFCTVNDKKSVDNWYLSKMFMQKRIEFMRDNPDMALALLMNRQQAYSYFFAMVRYMQVKHNVSVTGINPKVRYMCWGCEKFPCDGGPYFTDILPDIRQWTDAMVTHPEPGLTLGPSWKFFQCSQCMVANYCSAECQKKDWSRRHNVSCLSREFSAAPKLNDMPFLHFNPRPSRNP